MNKIILNAVSALSLAALPLFTFAQAPTLGSAAKFVLFTTTGAVTNTGPSHITGDIGTNNGSSTGFGNVNGNMENNNGATAAAASDLLNAYNQLDATAAAFFPAGLLGNGDTLHAGVYEIAGNATLNLSLTLDADNDPNAVFIIRVNGTFSAGVNSEIILIEGAKACNVFWQVEGLTSFATGSSLKGNFVVNNAAINMNANSSLEGRALSTTGAISVSSVLAYLPTGCGSPVLTGPAAPTLASVACYALFSGNGPVTNAGITTVTGDVGTNVGLTTGFNPLLVTGMIHPIPDGSTAAAAADLLNVYNYLNTLPVDITLLYPAQFGQSLVLTPHVYLLNGAASLTDTLYLNAEGNANAVFVIKINGALSTSTFATVVLTNGTQAKNVFWKVEGATEINDFSKFVGTLVGNNGAISLKTGTQLDGRALTTNGAFTTASINAVIPTSCTAATGLTINQTQPATATNFQSFTAFSAYLNTTGVSSPIIVDVVTGTGPYLEQVEFNSVNGSSASNTITINGNGNVLRGMPTRRALHVMKINGTDFFTVSNLTIESAPGAILGWGIHLRNDARNVTIQNSIITVNSTSTAKRDFMGIVATASDGQYNYKGNNVTNLTVMNTTITGGFMGIRINGDTIGAAFSTGISLLDNTINESYSMAISVNKLMAPVINRNTVMMRAGNVVSQGMQLVDNAGSVSVQRNKVINAGMYGLYLMRININGAGAPLIANNMIGGGFQNSVETYGIMLNDVDNARVVYNSVNVDNGSMGIGLDVYKPYSTGLDIRNNSLAYTDGGAGYAMRIGYASSVAKLDYNNYYSNGTAFVFYNGRARATLTILKAVAAGPANHDGFSKEGNPNYSSATNLHASGSQLGNSGIAISGITVDFDGDSRSATPSIGADEFGPARYAGTAASGAMVTTSVYPNPVSGTVLNLEATVTETGTLQLSITDLLGRVVLQQSALVTEGVYRQALNLPSGMSSGLYLMTVTQNGEQSQLKFRKQ